MRTIQSVSFIFVTLLLFSLSGKAQQVDFDRVVTPVDFKAKTFEEYLVQLAWNNSPASKVLDIEVAIAKQEQKIQRKEWTKDLSVQLNYNEAHFYRDFFYTPDEDDQTDPLVQSLIFPRFNFGAIISLGTILNYKHEKQIAKLKTEIAEHNIDQEKLEIRAKVLEAYQEYQTAEATTLLRIQAEEDANQSYELSRTLFKAGQAKLEEFTAAAEGYFKAREATLDSRSTAQLARIKLEELIGVSLEEAKRFGPKEEAETTKGKEKKK